MFHLRSLHHLGPLALKDGEAAQQPTQKQNTILAESHCVQLLLVRLRNLLNDQQGCSHFDRGSLQARELLPGVQNQALRVV